MTELSESMVNYLITIDHHDHEAMIALDEETGERDRWPGTCVTLSVPTQLSSPLP